MRNVAFFTLILGSVLHFSLQTCNKKTINVGTTLFSESDLLKDCWSTERITLLTYRMVLEDILPSPDVLQVKGEDFVIEIVDYFKLVLEVVRRISDVNSKHLMLLALSDLLGGYLNYAVLPIAKFAYYGGTLNYENTEKLFQLFDELKCFLRTNGEGWEKPMTITSDQLDIKPLPAETPNPGVNPCKGLIYYEHLPDEVKKQSGQAAHCTFEIPMPFLDSKSHPTAIAVPFKTFSLRNLESKASSYVLVKYYMAAHKCLAYKKSKADDISTFDNRFFTWINRFVISHLPDEKLYAAFGGVLRVYMSLKERAGHSGSKEIGNYNVMPEVEEKEPINELEGAVVQEKQKKNIGRWVLYIVLAVLLIWFLLGAMFICYKIRANRSKCLGDREDACTVCCSDGKFSKISTSWPKIHSKSSGPSVKSEKKAKSAGDLPKKAAASTASSVKSEKKTKPTKEFPSLKFGSIFLSNKNEKKEKFSPRKQKKVPCVPAQDTTEKKAKSTTEKPAKSSSSAVLGTKSEKKAQSAAELPQKPPSTVRVESEKKIMSAAKVPTRPPSSSASSVKSEKRLDTASEKSSGGSATIVELPATPSTAKSRSSWSKEQTTPSASKSHSIHVLPEAPSITKTPSSSIPRQETAPSIGKSRSTTASHQEVMPPIAKSRSAGLPQAAPSMSKSRSANIPQTVPSVSTSPSSNVLQETTSSMTRSHSASITQDEEVLLPMPKSRSAGIPQATPSVTSKSRSAQEEQMLPPLPKSRSSGISQAAPSVMSKSRSATIPQAAPSITSKSRSAGMAQDEEMLPPMPKSRSSGLSQAAPSVMSKSRSAGVAQDEEMMPPMPKSRSENIPQTAPSMMSRSRSASITHDEEMLLPPMPKSRSEGMPRATPSVVSKSRSAGIPEMAPSMSKSRSPSISEQEGMPPFMSKSRSAEPFTLSKTQQASLVEDEISEETQTSVEQLAVVIDQAAEADFPPEEGEDEDASTVDTDTTDDATLLVISTNNYYPPDYACHTSMAGMTTKPSSSTGDTSEHHECQHLNDSFVLGYDFQTTSSESSSAGDGSDSEDMAGNMSR